MEAQIIKTTCCGVIFAACMAPYCYTDKDWQKDLRKYAKEGRIIETTKEEFAFGKCKCEGVPKK